MPAAAASALRPMATRTPLTAMTAVHALCRIAKRIPDQPNNFRREESDSTRFGSGMFAVSRRFRSAVEFSGTAIEFNEAGNSRPIGCVRESLGALRGFRWLGDFDSPRQLAGIHGANADLVRLRGSDLADPRDSKASFTVPAAFYFNDFAWRSEIGDAIEAGSVFANVQRVGALGKGIAAAVFTPNKNAECLAGALAAPRLPPKVRDGFRERETYLVTAS